MCEKDIFKAFNNMNIDEHEFDNVEINISDIQKKKLKNDLKNKIKRNKFKKLKICAASAAAILVCITGIGYINPSFASQIPGLNPIVQTLNYYGDQGEYAKYSEIINKTVSFNGVSFTINSVVCDENSLIIGYTIKSNKKIDSQDLPGLSPSFKINGIPMSSGWGAKLKNTTANTYIGTMELSMARKLYFPNKFKFDMSFKSLLGMQGNWDFKFIVSREALDSETRSFKPNLNVKLKDATIKIKKVSLTPVNTTILFDSNKDVNNYGWLVFDSSGNELSFKSGNTSNGLFSKYESAYNYSKANKTVNKLILIPYKLTNVKDTVVPINSKLPLQISQGKNGKVNLTSINILGDKLIIHGTATGNFPQRQIKYIGINSTDKNADTKIRNLKTDTKKISNSTYEFTLEYSGINSSVSYSIAIDNLDYIDYSKKIEIPLKN